MSAPAEGTFAAWALARAGGAGTVAWLGAGAEGLGTRVRHDAPAGAEARARWLSELVPAWVVLGEVPAGALGAQLAAALEAAPDARVLLEVPNPLGAAALVAELVAGRAPSGGLTRAAVEATVRAAGGWLVACDAVAGTGAPSPAPLAEATARALGDVLAQLAPDAVAAAWRLVVARGADAGAHVTPLEERVSVVLQVAAAPDPERLDQVCFALACQEHPGLEVWVVGPGAHAAEPLLTRYAPLGDATFHLAGGSWGQGLERVRGRYVAFLDADCVIYPDHFSRLLAPLRAGGAAWSLGRVRRVTLRGGAPAYVVAKQEVPPHARVTLADLRSEPGLGFGCLVDRARVGGFRLVTPEVGPDTLPLRLAALFEPAPVEGIPSVELQSQPAVVPAPEHVLARLDALERLWGGGAPGGAEPTGLRHRLLDTLNLRLKQRAPGLHAWAKRQARGWLWRVQPPGT